MSLESFVKKGWEKLKNSARGIAVAGILAAALAGCGKDNAKKIIIPPTKTINPYVYAQVITPKSDQSGNIQIPFVLTTENNCIANVVVEYRSRWTDGKYKTATPAPESCPTEGLLATNEGNEYTFVWDSVADRVATVVEPDDVTIRITPIRPVAGSPIGYKKEQAETGMFRVDNCKTPDALIIRPTDFPSNRIIPVEFVITNIGLYENTSGATLKFSIDDGNTFEIPTLARSVRFEGQTGKHSYRAPYYLYSAEWDSFADKVALDKMMNQCRLKVILHTTDGDKEFVCSRFTIDNRIYVDGKSTNYEEGTPSNPFRRIQDGINAAIEGQAVFVKPGTYYENIFINKTHKLVALTGYSPDYTIIDANNYGSCIDIDGKNGLIIENFKITNGRKDMWADMGDLRHRNGAGINILNSPNITLKNLLVVNNYLRNNNTVYGGGISAWACDNLNIVKCTISGNHLESLTDSAAGAGVRCSGGTKLTMKNCIVYLNKAVAPEFAYHGVIAEAGSVSNYNNIDYRGTGIPPGEGDINPPQDPKFVDPENSNFHLQSDSPCKDANGKDIMGCYAK